MSDGMFLSLHDILRVLFKRARLIIGVTVIAVLSCGVYILLKPPLYEATSQILVRRAAPDTADISLAQENRGPTSIIRQVNQTDEINTEMAMMNNQDLVAQVIEGIGLTKEQFDYVPDYRRYVRIAYQTAGDAVRAAWNETKYALHVSRRPTAEELAEWRLNKFIRDVMRGLVVEQVPDSDVVKVGFRCSDPALARRLADVFCERTISWHIDKLTQPGSLPFYQEQVEKARAALEDVEQKYAAERSRLDLIGAEERSTLLVRHELESKARLNEINARKAALDAGIAQLENTLATESPVVTLSKETSPNPVWQQISQKLAEEDLKQLEASTRFSETGRVVKDMRQAIQGGRALADKTPQRLESLVTEGVNTVYQALQQTMLMQKAERAALEAEARVIVEQIAAFDSDLKTLNEHLYKIDALKRQRDSLASTYDSYIKNAELARASEDKQKARLANLAVVQKAGLPLSPVRPRKWLYLALAAAAGFLFGVGWAFAAEFGDSTVSSERDLVEELNLRVFGTLKKCA